MARWSGIMRVGSDAEAIRLMNESPYGLTAALFSSDVAAAEAIGAQIETGTVFLNRCDSLDPCFALGRGEGYRARPYSVRMGLRAPHPSAIVSLAVAVAGKVPQAIAFRSKL